MTTKKGYMYEVYRMSNNEYISSEGTIYHTKAGAIEAGVTEGRRIADELKQKRSDFKILIYPEYYEA